MKAESRNRWLTALALLPILAAPVAGDSPAFASGRTRACTLRGAWHNTDRGTTNNFDLTGTLRRMGDSGSFFFGQYRDGQYTAEVDGQEFNGRWSFNFAYTSGSSETGMVKVASGQELPTEANNQFSVEGSYATYINRVDINRSGDFTLSGTCVRD